jgi:hypothetical protein
MLSIVRVLRGAFQTKNLGEYVGSADYPTLVSHQESEHSELVCRQIDDSTRE